MEFNPQSKTMASTFDKFSKFKFQNFLVEVLPTLNKFKFQVYLFRSFQFPNYQLAMREIVSIQVGNCGNKVGEKVSKRFCNDWFYLFRPFDSSGKQFPMNTTSTDVGISMETAFCLINGWTCTTNADLGRFSYHAPCCVISSLLRSIKSGAVALAGCSILTALWRARAALVTTGLAATTQKALNSSIAFWTSLAGKWRTAIACKDFKWCIR